MKKNLTADGLDLLAVPAVRQSDARRSCLREVSVVAEEQFDAIVVPSTGWPKQLECETLGADYDGRELLLTKVQRIWRRLGHP